MSIYQESKEIAEQQLLDKFKDLIIEHNELTGSNIPTEYDLELSKTQKAAFERFKTEESLLILGSAGCGKSYIIKEFHRWVTTSQQKTIYVTSTTGISAFNIGGITINSFMGIGTGESSVETLIKRLKYKVGIKNRIKMTDILVIDEISMMSAAVFEKINHICQILRKSSKPFGGIQIVLTGDFLQLETVFNRNILGKDQDTRFIIESELFKKMFKKSTIVLKKNFRQSSDHRYIDLLLRIREGNHTEEDINLLKTRLAIKPHGNHVHIVNSNKSAQIINESKLSNINEPIHQYVTQYKDSGKDAEIDELLINELKFQFKQKGIDILELKKGARVMLTKNIDVSIGLVNGSIGVIDSFTENQDEKFPIVIFDNIHGKHVIYPVSIELELNNCTCIASQIPLMLSYALTTHKLQGLSLDSAILDLSTAFCNGQVYVALSRVKSFDGVYLKSFDPSKIKVNKKMKEFLDNLI